MLKNVINAFPAHIKFLSKLYLLNLIVFLFIRFVFYFVNQSSGVSAAAFSEKLLAFKMGVEFDTAVFCWIVVLPMLIFSLNYFLNPFS